MQTKEIAHDQWQDFFSEFTHLHRGERICVETLGGGQIGVCQQMSDLPLIGIVDAEPDAADEWIEIIAGADEPARASHSIPHPTHVWVAEHEDGRALAVQVESTDGQVTMIRVA
ncbi:MAG TPA: DUF5335 family protein [Tepidisphaeraceae bacterium]|nr:DUF5335 family protein [Tepidisphaeraceae bacterium]